MSLRGLAGVRILGGLGGGGDRQANGTISPLTLPEIGSERVWIGIRQIQMALHAVRRVEVRVDGDPFGPIPALPDPGPVDGQWGRRTATSFLALLQAVATTVRDAESANWREELGSGTAEDRMLINPLWARFFVVASRFYRRPASDSGDATVDPGGSATPPRADPVPDPGEGGSDLDTNYSDALVVRRGLPWWAWLLLAIGAVGAGYGIWRYYKNRR